MKRLTGILLIFLFISGISVPRGNKTDRIRKPVDPVGFATSARQMDSVMARIRRLQGDRIENAWNRLNITKNTTWKAAVCPHDDYTYAGWLYPALLRNIKANTVILVGVAHKAKKFGLEDRLVFDSFDKWQEPYGLVSISPLREQIMNNLPRSDYIVHDSMQMAEHSLEAIVPFLQYYNRGVKIVPILVPYMSFETTSALSFSLANAISRVMRSNDLSWKKDIAIVISTDAVHYGDTAWGGLNYAPYGCDSSGYRQAVAHEYEIIRNTLTGDLDKDMLEEFYKYTVSSDDYKKYKWTWCGRYSVPLGLLTALNLQKMTATIPLKGVLVGYANSIDHPSLPVEDLGMGKTAIATMNHWVGYAAIGYR